MNQASLGKLKEVWFQSAGARLFAVEIGHGRPLVFLHGGLADHRAALLRVGPLASEYRLVLPDLRASGRSVYRGELGWDLWADDLHALLSHLGVARAVVGGTSMGSAVALRFALRHPERTLGLVLAQPLYPGRELGLAEAARAAMRAMDTYGRRAPREGIEVLSALYERLPDSMRARALQMMRGFDAESIAATTRFLASDAQPFERAAELSALRVPTLLVPGSDPEHPAEVCALYARHLPDPRLLDPATDFPTALAAFCAELNWE